MVHHIKEILWIKMQGHVFCSKCWYFKKVLFQDIIFYNDEMYSYILKLSGEHIVSTVIRYPSKWCIKMTKDESKKPSDPIRVVVYLLDACYIPFFIILFTLVIYTAGYTFCITLTL